MEDKRENIEVKDVIQVDSELLENITHLIKDKASESLLNIFTDIHNADIAEIVNHLNFENAEYAFSLLDSETASEVITELDENLREKILQNIDASTISNIIDELESDDATDIISDLPEDIADEVLSNIDIEDSEEVKELLKYDEESAGGIMSSDYVSVQDTDTIRTAVKEVRDNAENFDQIYHIYVVKEGGDLIGIVPLKFLLTHPTRTQITSVMEEDLIYVTPDIDQEEVANIMKKYDLVAIPVVDEEKKLLGRITIDDIVDVMQEEADEDIQKLVGLSEEQESSDSVFRISRIRLPWLLIALAIEMVGVLLLSKYEFVLQKVTIAAFFFPVVMAMGGSSGSQAAIVMVKVLGTGDIWFKESLKKLLKELSVAVLNGIIISAALFTITIIFFDDIPFLITLSLSLLFIIIFATMLGATIPIILKRLNADPAVATGPFVTTMNDILGLLIYMTFVTLFIVL